MSKNRVYFFGSYEAAEFELTASMELVFKRRLPFADRAEQAKTSDGFIVRLVSDKNRLELVSRLDGSLVCSFDGQPDFDLAGSCDSPDYSRIFASRDDEATLLWNNCRRGIALVNLRYQTIECQFSNFWPHGNQPRFATVDRPSKRIVGFSVSASGTQTISVLSYHFDTKKPDIVQIDLATLEEWVGVELSDDGKYLIVATLIDYKEQSGAQAKLFRIKAMTYDSLKISVIREKLLPVTCSGKSPVFKKASGTGGEVYVLADRGHLTVVRFISTIVEFEVAASGASVEVYSMSDISDIACGPDFVVALASQQPREHVKIVAMK